VYSAYDADLLAIELARAGLEADLRRVATRDAYAEALAAFAPDAVVSDYDLPGFSGGEALVLARAHDAALPFVVLSGFVAEDRPADDRARGADAWVCKDRMHEIATVLRRLLRR
jgi:CheY-like chemotaxis protein